MINRGLARLLTTTILLCVGYLATMSQSPGLIVRPAGGPYSILLDTNRNGYTSSSLSGFVVNDITESELSYKVVPPAVTEPTGDLATGPSGGFTDIVKTVDNSGFYIYSDGINLFFRLRIGGIISGSKGYSVLIDTDQKMGNTGIHADPDYVAATNTSNGNPGFEFEVVLRTNFRVEVYNVGGTGNPVSSSNYPLNTHSQISVALSRDGNNPDYFYDWCVPLTSIGSPASIRMAATTVTSPGSALQGSRSDIYGINDAASGVTKGWETVVNAQPAITITGGALTSVGATCTAAPVINSPISIGSSLSVSGTWTRMDASKASEATITLYRNNVIVNTATVTTGNPWAITVPVVNDGDVFYAKAQSLGESQCLQSESVKASACLIPPAAPVITCASQKGITGNIPLNSTILLYQVTSANGNPTTTPVLLNITYPTTTTFAYYNNACGGSGSPLTAGTTYMIKTVSSSGCVSGSTLICIQGSGSVNNLSANTISITTPIYPFQTKINGSNATVGELIRLFINDTYIASHTATQTTFMFEGLTLKANDSIRLYSQGATCMTASAKFYVSCYNSPPIISTDVNGKLLSSATSIAGTAMPNASITLNRTSPTLANWTTTANSAGNWTVNGLTLAATQIYTATVSSATVCTTPSQPSLSASVLSPTLVCPTFTGSYTDLNTSVTGSITTASTGTIRLYLDEVLTGSFNVVSTGTSTWTVSPLSNPLYNGGILRVSFQAGTDAEHAGCGTTTVTCASPATPSISPVSSTIQTGQTVNYTVSNVASGAWYAIMGNTGLSYAKSIYTNSGAGFNLTTNTFPNPGTYNIKLSADKLSGCAASFVNATIVVNQMILPVAFKNVSAERDNNNINVSWNVENELSVSHYIVERSYDCQVFETIGTVVYKPSVSSMNRYSFSDKSFQQHDKICYRIKQVDEDYKHTYSSIASVSTLASPSLTVWPNPAVNQVVVNLSSSASGQVEINLFDVNGKNVLYNKFHSQQGSTTLSIDNLDKFQRGVYLLKITSGKINYYHKLVLR